MEDSGKGWFTVLPCPDGPISHASPSKKRNRRHYKLLGQTKVAGAVMSRAAMRSHKFYSHPKNEGSKGTTPPKVNGNTGLSSQARLKVSWWPLGALHQRNLKLQACAGTSTSTRYISLSFFFRSAWGKLPSLHVPGKIRAYQQASAVWRIHAHCPVPTLVSQL